MFSKFEKVDADLKKAAVITVKQVLQAKAGEKALIVTNDVYDVFTIGKALFDELEENGVAVTLMVQKTKTLLDFAEESVAMAIRSEPDILISLSAEKLGKDKYAIANPYIVDGKEIASAFNYLQAVKKCRSFWTPGITLDMFKTTVPIDYQRLEKECRLVKEVSSLVSPEINHVRYFLNSPRILTHHTTDSLNTNRHSTFQITNKWFKTNLLSSNYAKTQCVQFRTKNAMKIDSKIIYGNNIISNVSHTKFLVLVIDRTLSSNTHIEGTVNKLRSVCYMFRSVTPYMSHSSLVMTYYALFHCNVSVGIIFWGNSTNKQKIFKLQKRAIIIITGGRNKDSSRILFKQLAVLPLKSQYIFYILLFVVKNRDKFATKYESHNIPT